MAAGNQDPFHHVRDANFFELPFGRELHLPEIPGVPSPSKIFAGGSWDPSAMNDVYGFQLTKFMLLQLAAALLVAAVFIPMAAKVRNGEPLRGRFWNFWETLLVFIRDEVVRPTIGDHSHEPHGGDANDPHVHSGSRAEGHYNPGSADPLKEANFDLTDPNAATHLHDAAASAAADRRVSAHGVAAVTGHPADRYLPLVWSLFFYILLCNLLGAIPMLGAPTGNINVTAVLAGLVFLTVIYSGVKASGGVGYLKSLVPSMELPGVLKPVLIPMIWLIEAMGLLIKHFVLAVRLFANLMAGHVVLGVLLTFITAAASLGWFMEGAVTTASVLGQVFVALLELFVAFMQAYVFAFLATLFIAGAVHPH